MNSTRYYPNGLLLQGDDRFWQLPTLNPKPLTAVGSEEIEESRGVTFKNQKELVMSLMSRVVVVV